MAREGFRGELLAVADFDARISKTTSAQSQSKVRVWTKRFLETEFAVQKYRSDGETERDVGPDRFRTVHEVIGISGNRALAFQGLVVARLKELTLHGVDLCVSHAGPDQ